MHRALDGSLISRRTGGLGWNDVRPSERYGLRLSSCSVSHDLLYTCFVTGILSSSETSLSRDRSAWFTRQSSSTAIATATLLVFRNFFSDRRSNASAAITSMTESPCFPGVKLFFVGRLLHPCCKSFKITI